MGYWVLHFTFSSTYRSWRWWRLKPRRWRWRWRLWCIVKTVQFVPNITTRKQYSCSLFSTTAYWKTDYCCLKTQVAISAGQVRCALYKVVQRLKSRDIHFVGPKLLNTDWNVRGLPCQAGHRGVHKLIQLVLVGNILRVQQGHSRPYDHSRENRLI